ncbi:DUF192 domain-containing protein [Acidobacteriota bacterium]
MTKNTILACLLALTFGFLWSNVTHIRIFFPDGKTIFADLVKSEEDRARGLMFRKTINEDQGMLFVFEAEGRYSFWMKNMNFSIDILWLDNQKRIVHLERDVPPCKKEPCPSYAPALPAKYVLELKAGSIEKRKLKLYDRIDFIL